MSLIQLIYVSSAIEELSDAQLDAILESSVRHNQPQAVTGMLLYSRGNFMQVLEGEEAAIDETYDRICQDPRHHNLFLLSREPIAEREFSTWNMAFRRLTRHDAEVHPAYAPYFINGFSAAEIGARRGLAAEMLKQFSKV